MQRRKEDEAWVHLRMIKLCKATQLSPVACSSHHKYISSMGNCQVNPTAYRITKMVACNSDTGV